MIKTKSGHTVERCSEDEKQSISKLFPSFADGYIRLYPGRWFHYPHFVQHADKIYDFVFQQSDVVIMTYPKSGTTWTQEIVWTMTNNSNLNNPSADMSLIFRVPYLEMEGCKDLSIENNPETETYISTLFEQFEKICPGKNPKNGISFQLLADLPAPRIIKTHLPFTLQNPKLIDTCKVVFVARNPKDVCVSFYHHCKLLKFRRFYGSLSDFVNLFTSDKVFISPYWEHFKEAWQNKHHPNLHWIFYEDMITNIKTELRRLNEFLGTRLCKEQLQKISELTSFHNMQLREPMYGMFKINDNKNAAFEEDFHTQHGGFYRKGIIGDWKQRLNNEDNKKLDEWIEKNLKEIGIDYTFSEIFNSK